MNPEQLEAHALSEIDRAESLLELFRTQKTPASEQVRARLAKLAQKIAALTETTRSAPAVKPAPIPEVKSDGR